MEKFSLKSILNISDCLSKVKSSKAIFLARNETPSFLTKREQDELRAIKFFSNDKRFHFFYDQKKNVVKVIIFSKDLDAWAIGEFIRTLPADNYKLDKDSFDQISGDVILSYVLSSYTFCFFKKHKKQKVTLNIPEKEFSRPLLFAKADYLVRNLVNMPANLLNTEQLASICKEFALFPKVSVKEIIGKKLIKKNFPLIYEVGKASENKPRLLEIEWKNKKNEQEIILVGKGVCFDSGGLNLKTNSTILLMKKDMGGAANALALAFLIIQLRLPINLRVLIPIVENSVSGNAFRPGDIIKSRKGVTVEVTNTDAEGRLILADALAYADEKSPKLVISLATLTGAARVALGSEIVPFFSTNKKFSKNLISLGEKLKDYVWPLPFFDGYNKYLNSDLADLINAPTSPNSAGAITAGLFLKNFVEKTDDFLHFDIYSWQIDKEPGKTKGGKMQTVRTLLEFLEKHQ